MRIVVALGGNALGCGCGEQEAAAQATAKAISGLVTDDNEVVLTHGNGPQVGMILEAVSSLTACGRGEDVPSLSACVAMSQGYIGSDISRAMYSALKNSHIDKEIITVLTHIAVSPDDEAFEHYTKPIGAFMSREEAERLSAETGVSVIEDAGRGWRQVVASPRPLEIIEVRAIKELVENGYLVVAAGGGGVPVVKDGTLLEYVPSVIDKDLASEMLAEQLDADILVILTSVDGIAVGYGTEEQRWLSIITPEEAEGYIAAGEFSPGSMLPKVQAAAQFARSKKGRRAIITSLQKVGNMACGVSGTVVRS